MHRLDLQFAVNVRAPFQLVSLLLPALRAAARRRPELGARIVAMSSIMGQAAEPGLAACGATKAALTMFCETVTSEEGANGGVVVWLAILGPATIAVASVSRVRGASMPQLIAAILMQNSAVSSGSCRIWLRAVSLQILVRAKPVIIWGRRWHCSRNLESSQEA
jgi:NAD(P)-dependent dehydrogenase (short-subunit alcohol dehydrogenase family)